MRKTAWVLVVLVVAQAPAQAREPSRSEQKFLRTLATALGHESADVVLAAQLGLDAMKGKAAWYLIREVRKFNDAKLAAAQDVLIALGEHTTKAIAEYGRLSSPMQNALQRVQDEIVKDRMKMTEKQKQAPPVAGSKRPRSLEGSLGRPHAQRGHREDLLRRRRRQRYGARGLRPLVAEEHGLLAVEREAPDLRGQAVGASAVIVAYVRGCRAGN